MQKIIIVIEGGCVKGVITETGANVQVIDLDIEGLEEEILTTIEGHRVYCWMTIEAERNPERVAHIWEKTKGGANNDKKKRSRGRKHFKAQNLH